MQTRWTKENNFKHKLLKFSKTKHNERFCRDTSKETVFAEKFIRRICYLLKETVFLKMKKKPKDDELLLIPRKYSFLNKNDNVESI